MDIIGYAQKNNKTFTEKPFDEIDAVMLAEFSYAKLEKVESDLGAKWSKKATLKDYFRAEYFDEMFNDGINDDENRRLTAAMASSRRYRDLKVRDVTSIIEENVQFAAMTFEINSDTYAVAFRGTDGTMIGWKEDFELSYRDEIPSQREAVKYIEKHCGRMGKFAGKKLILTGHSKGGNLAVYAACICSPKISRNIKAVFSLDGPGFNESIGVFMDEEISRRQLDIHRIIPQHSIVGLLFSGYEDCRIIKSDSWGINQHSAFSWEIEDDSFIYLDSPDWGSEFLNRTISTWLDNQTDEKRRIFVESIFDILEANDIRNIVDLGNLSKMQIISLLKQIDPESHEVVSEVMKNLALSAVTNIKA